MAARIISMHESHKEPTPACLLSIVYSVRKSMLAFRNNQNDTVLAELVYYIANALSVKTTIISMTKSTISSTQNYTSRNNFSVEFE
jgi:hypothetical protein